MVTTSLYLVQTRVAEGKGDMGTTACDKYVRATGEREAIALAQDEDTLEIVQVWPICTGPVRQSVGQPRRRYDTTVADTVRAALPYLGEFSKANAELQAALEEAQAL